MPDRQSTRDERVIAYQGYKEAQEAVELAKDDLKVAEDQFKQTGLRGPHQMFDTAFLDAMEERDYEDAIAIMRLKMLLYYGDDSATKDCEGNIKVADALWLRLPDAAPAEPEGEASS